MKHTITLITALLLPPLAALNAADSSSLQPPRHVGKPKPEHTVTNRAFQGIPSMAVAPGGRLWANWHAGVTPGEDHNNYVVLSTSDRNILMATFREEDALAGKDVSGEVKLRQLVSKASGGREKAVTKEPVNDNANGKPLRTKKPGTLASEGIKPQSFGPGAKLFSDRSYIVAEVPDALQAAHFLPIPMDGRKTLACQQAGVVYFLTPQPERNRDTQSQLLMDQGFEKVALPEVRLFGGSPNNFCTLYQKDCAAGETIRIGKWALPWFIP